MHGRILSIERTAAGQALLQRCRERVQALEQQLAASLGPEDEATVRAWLAGIADAAR